MQQTRASGTEIIMPQFAESVVSATIGKWLKQPGELVEEYEPLCEVITDKVTAELPSTAAGILLKLLAAEGSTVDVGTVICLIQENGDVGQTAVGAVTVAPSNSSSAARNDSALTGDQSMRHRYSPAVRTLAEDHNLDLNLIAGSGLGGRITRKDVLDYIESGGSKQSHQEVIPAPLVRIPSAASANEIPMNAPKEPVRSTGLHLSDNKVGPHVDVEHRQSTDSRGEYYIDITPIRNTIASRMRQSVTEIPHAWTMIEVDVTNLVTLRNKMKDEFKRKEGVNLTYLAFLIKSVVNAIKDYPIMNSVWGVDNIIVKRDINISLAVGTEDSVMTPVIRQADQKNIPGLAREIEQLASKTRSGKLTLADMQGGTFTINNTGSFGSILSYPIINYPQAAILTFESIVKKPVVINDMIAVRSMSNLCLSLDHRILDGVICGRFLQRVKENLESFTPDTNLY
ncbi:MAG: dihydrolipoamide acetyltransferase family protein [Paenibacillaceae bacterium]